MALTFDQLQALLKAEQIQFYLAPDRPAVRFGIGGLYGKYDIVIHLQDDGRFLQFRTLGYAECPSGHAHIAEVLKVIADINLKKRLLKLGWDASDGEIVGYADLWVMDGTVTQEQFRRMLHNFIPGIDTSSTRIRAIIESGKDPGEPDPSALLKDATGDAPSSLPPRVRELLERLRKKTPAEPGTPPAAPIKEI
jgi:hypothetical protein